jgi:hypothetical protein
MRFTRGKPLHGFSSDLEDTRIQSMRSGDHFDERRFPRAIFAKQRVDFPGSQFKRNFPQCAHSTERLGDVRESEERGRFWHDPVRFPYVLGLRLGKHWQGATA